MKRFFLLVMVVLIVAVIVGIVGAQDGPKRPDRARDGVIREVLQVTAEETGLTVREIVDALRADDTTLADVIESNGGSVDVIIDAAVTSVNERVNEALANDRITQEQADRLLENIEQVITDGINGDLERPVFGHGRIRGFIRKMAEATGLDAQDIITQLREGAIPADILTENGVDVDAFIDDLMVKAEERLANAVENGRITQEQADERLENIRTRLTDRLNNPIPQRDTMPPEAEPGS